MIRKSPKKFTEEFKKEAVRLVTEHGYTQRDAAESLGVSSKNLNRWIHKKVDAEKVPPNEKQEEILLLKKRIHRLELEREILKKAAAFFASEPN
jgi:transposase